MPAFAQVLNVTLQPPTRDFGYFIGDTMVAQAMITVAPGTVVDPQSLPTPGAVAAAIDVRRVSVSRDGALVRVRVEYQTFVAPEEAMQVRVPSYALIFRNGGQTFTAPVPYWSFYTSPFRHERAVETDPAALRTDHAIPLGDLSLPRNGLLASLGVAAVAFFVLAGLRGWRPRFGWRRAPFAQAVRQVSAAPPQAAAIALHRAFDATAGCRVLADDIDAFLDGHAHFQPLRPDIIGFFNASRAMFFGGGLEVAPDNFVKLAKRLRRAERMA